METRKTLPGLRALEKAAEKSRPELVLVSAGFDAHCYDELASFYLESADYGYMAARLAAVNAPAIQASVCDSMDLSSGQQVVYGFVSGGGARGVPRTA